jgi:hypothetical protein
MNTATTETRSYQLSGTGFSSFPEAGSEAEKEMFRKLQEKLRPQFEHIFPDKLAPRTVVVIPSLSIDEEILSKVSGINHYEERMLCLLMLLRMPRTNVIYVTSQTIDPGDYRLLPAYASGCNRISCIAQAHDVELSRFFVKVIDPENSCQAKTDATNSGPYSIRSQYAYGVF